MLVEEELEDNAIPKPEQDVFALVRQWASAMADRGLYAANTARFKAQAVEALASVLGRDEPRTLEYMLQNLDEITSRWIVKERANPATGKTYQTRAKTLIEDYRKYVANPREFKGRHRTPRPGSAEVRREPEENTSNLLLAEDVRGNDTTSENEDSPEVERELKLRNYPLTQGGSFQFVEPPQTFVVKDAVRIFYHLVTMAPDFDPTDPTQAKIFALVRRD